jgi:hypothetical protein
MSEETTEVVDKLVIPEGESVVEPIVTDPNATDETVTGPKEEEAKEEEAESTGNEFVDSLLGEFKANGIDADKLFGNYSESGDEKDIDFAYLESKVGKLAAQGLIAGFKAENEKLERTSEASTKTIYDAAGGEAMWDGIVKWIGEGQSGLSKAGGEAYNAMLAAGGVQAELAARELSTMYKQSPGFTQDASLQSADQSAQPQGIQPISRIDYVEQLDAVVRKSGEHSPEAKALHERRIFSMQNGV